MQVPVVRTREASSGSSPEGQIFVLSGLNMQQDTETITSVPFRFPVVFLGRLFKSNLEPGRHGDLYLPHPYVVREEEEAWPGAGKNRQ